MSRSRRKTPIRGVCGSRHHVTEKDEKRIFNRAWRRTVRQLLKQGEEEIFPTKNEVADVWGWSKDGKWRFDPKKHPKEMRK